MDTNETIVEVEGVQKWFGDFHALKGINLKIERGEVVCLIGPSGSGKSTFLRTINHLESINEGRIRVNGHLVGYRESNGKLVTEKERVTANNRQDIGMVFQDFNLFWHLTLLDNVTLGPRSVLGLSKREAAERAEELLEQVGLLDKQNNFPSSLSGGQQQRGAIARALAMRPSLMLFDEPTSALDPDMSKEVIQTVERLADDGMTMVMVSHEMSFVHGTATRVIMMSDGYVTEDIRDLTTSGSLEGTDIGGYLQSVL